MMMSNRYYIHSVDTCRQSSALPIVNIEFVINGQWSMVYGLIEFSCSYENYVLGKFLLPYVHTTTREGEICIYQLSSTTHCMLIRRILRLSSSVSIA